MTYAGAGAAAGRFAPVIHLPSGRDRWEKSEVDLPATESSANGLRALMLGSGLSAAANPDSPGWGELIRRVARRLDEEISPRLDPRVAALNLSWRYARLPVTAEETEFQSNVAAEIVEHDATVDAELGAAVGRLLRVTRCSVILDLNYDRVAEALLEQEDVPFYRIVGAQIDVVPPLPDDTTLLWKVHGSVDYPSTIVLSPTEYQRIYETNELGNELTSLGRKLSVLWTVGVGLTDDDVWTYLCSAAAGLEIIAIRLSTETAAEEIRDNLGRWGQVVAASARRVTVFAGPRPERPEEPQLAHRLRDVLSILDDGRRRRQAPGAAKIRLKKEVEARYAAFDEQYGAAIESGRWPGIYPVLEEFRPDYDNLCHTLLTKTAEGSGHRWMPGLTGGECRLDRDRLRRLSADLAEVVDSAGQCFSDYVKPPGSGLLVAACAQYVVQYVIDLIRILGVEHEIIQRWPDDGSDPVLPRERKVLIGANPFLFGKPGQQFNLFHFYRSNRRIVIRYPLWGARSRPESPNPGPRGDSATLLTEDEWEACVVDLYSRTGTELRLDSRTFELSWLPPIYPWGFGFNRLNSYRRQSPGTISTAWHLVSNRLEPGRQVCKGGSLRDQSPEAFMIARRGKVRIGEYDDFVQRAAV